MLDVIEYESPTKGIFSKKETSELMGMEFARFLRAGFRVIGDDVVNPFVLSNPTVPTAGDFLVFNENSKTLLRFIEGVITYEKIDFKVEQVRVGDGKKNIKMLDGEMLRKVREEKQKSMWLPKFRKYSYDEMTKVIKSMAEKKLIKDLQIQIILKIIDEYDVFTWGVLIKKNKEQIIKEKIKSKGSWWPIILQDALYNDISLTFKLPFREFISNIKGFEKKDVYDVFLYTLSEKYQNEQLPVKEIPLFLFEKFTDDENKELIPERWQMYFMMNRKRYNFCLWPRQSGKTYMSAWLIAITETFLPTVNNVMFVCKNEWVFEQPRLYIKRFAKAAEKYNVIKIGSDYTAKNMVTGNEIRFVSAGSDMGVRSFSPKVFIFEEGSYLPNSAWFDAIPIIEKKDGVFYSLSTLNWKSKEQQTDRFMQEALAGEMGMDEDYFTMRVTIDDIEHMKPSNRERMKRNLKGIPDRYFCELYAIFPWTGNLFDDQSFFIMKELGNQLKDNFLISVDLWKKHDPSWITVINLNQWLIVEERRLHNMMYVDQKEVIREMKKKYNDAFVAIDWSWVGHWVIEIFGDLVNYVVVYTTGNTINKSMKWGIWVFNVPKKDLVYNFISMIEEKELHAMAYLEALRQEMDTFGIAKSNNGSTKYQAQSGSTDDVLNSAFIWAFIYKETFLKYKSLLAEVQLKSDRRFNVDEDIWEESPVDLTKQRYDKFVY